MGRGGNDIVACVIMHLRERIAKFVAELPQGVVSLVAPDVPGVLFPPDLMLEVEGRLIACLFTRSRDPDRAMRAQVIQARLWLPPPTEIVGIGHDHEKYLLGPDLLTSIHRFVSDEESALDTKQDATLQRVPDTTRRFASDLALAVLSGKARSVKEPLHERPLMLKDLSGEVVRHRVILESHVFVDVDPPPELPEDVVEAETSARTSSSISRTVNVDARSLDSDSEPRRRTGASRSSAVRAAGKKSLQRLYRLSDGAPAVTVSEPLCGASIRPADRWLPLSLRLCRKLAHAGVLIPAEYLPHHEPGNR